MGEEPKIKTSKDIERWNWKLWLWVFLCSMGIFTTIPVARNLQKFVYNTVGREFFTYVVLFVVCIGLAILLYLFIFKLKVKKISQYIWLFICAGLYIYHTIQLRAHPEEAIHFLMYGLLSYFLFKALSYRIHDWTVYLTAVFFVLFIGTTDEFLQWMMPQRFWDFKDVGLNMLAGGIFLLGVWKGINPTVISKPVKKISVGMLAGIITANLIFMGLCLSNTPNFVNRYTTAISTLSWLQNEEVMSDYGYIHKDPEIGTFYSRLTLEQLKEIDLINGESYAKNLPQDINSKAARKELVETYKPYTHPFLYEFLLHLFRRNTSLDKLEDTNVPFEKIRRSNIAFRENLLVEKYFSNTLKHSMYAWSDEEVEELKTTASLWKGDYKSRAGKMLTLFSLKGILAVIFITLVIVWVSAEFWKRRLK